MSRKRKTMEHDPPLVLKPSLSEKTSKKRKMKAHVVEAVIDKRIAKDVSAEYLLKWEGFSESENSWFLYDPVIYGVGVCTRASLCISSSDY